MLPESEFEMAGKTAGWSDFAAMAQATEECGFDSIWFADHLQLKLPDGRDQGAWECWSILSAIAATTTRIELGPFVTATAYRNPALLARIAETVDEISGGRLIFGIGAGWAEHEYRVHGWPYDQGFAGAVAVSRVVISFVAWSSSNATTDSSASAEDCQARVDLRVFRLKRSRNGRSPVGVGPSLVR